MIGWRTCLSLYLSVTVPVCHCTCLSLYLSVTVPHMCISWVFTSRRDAHTLTETIVRSYLELHFSSRTTFSKCSLLLLAFQGLPTLALSVSNMYLSATVYITAWIEVITNIILHATYFLHQLYLKPHCLSVSLSKLCLYTSVVLDERSTALHFTWRTRSSPHPTLHSAPREPQANTDWNELTGKLSTACLLITSENTNTQNKIQNTHYMLQRLICRANKM